MRSGRTAPLGMLHPRSSSTPIRTGLAWHRSQLRWRWCNKWGKVTITIPLQEPSETSNSELLPPERVPSREAPCSFRELYGTKDVDLQADKTGLKIEIRLVFLRHDSTDVRPVDAQSWIIPP